MNSEAFSELVGVKSAAHRHHLPLITVQRQDGKVKICPHCHQEVTEKSLYRDAKGWIFHRPCFMKGKGSIKEADAPVIHERQTNDYNCGPAVLKSVENTMGVGHPNIKTYETETGANDENGTPITQLEATAAKHGLKVNSFGQMSPEQLQQATATGKPVIVAMQMDGEQGGPKGGWEAGHYVVVTGTDGQNVKFMDPSSEAPERTLPLNEFLGRWHDHDHNGKVYQQWGMTLQHPAEVKQAEDKEGATGWRKRVNVVPMPSGEGFNMVFKAGPEHPERVIGQTHLARGAYGTAYPGMIEVDPEFASRGLGAGRKFLADMARQLPGQEIHSGQVFTDAGQALWESARRKARPGVNIDKSLSFQTVKNMIRGKVSNNLKALQPYGMTMPAASAQLVDPLIARHFPGPVKSLAQPQAQPQLKLAYSGSLGSGATSGQGTDPPRLVDASGSTPAGPENQPASDAVPCDSTHLDNCDQHPDPLVFNMADLEKAAISPFETMSVGTEETQEPSDNTGAQWTGHGRDNSGSSPWKDRLREIADSYEAHQDSSSAGAGGRTQAPSGPGFQTGQSAQNSGATSAPEADGPSMQLDSDTISTGQVPHLNA